MNRIIKIGMYTSALALASGAAAQTTPEAYLQEFIELNAKMGFTTEIGSQERDGDRLVLRNLKMLADNQYGNSVTNIEAIYITEIDDPDYELELTTVGSVTIKSTSVQQGSSTTTGMSIDISGGFRIGGTAQDRILGFNYENISVSLDEIRVDDSDILPFTMSFEINNYLGRMELSNVDDTYTSVDTASKISFSLVGTELIQMKVVGTYFDMESTTSSVLLDYNDPIALFSSVVPTVSEMKIARSSLDAEIQTDNGDVLFVSTSGRSSIEGVIGAGGMDFTTVSEDVKVNVSGSALPLPPIDAAMEEFGFRFAMPLIKSDIAGLVALRLSLEDLTVTESLWSMIDPGQAIPRDPATFVIDITSAARILVNFLDEAELENLGASPFLFEDITLNDLKLSLGGAEITGRGTAVLNNDGPVPLPVGGVDFKIVGINGLIGKLTEAGLLQPEQAMPAQMMLGMFAKPGDEQDVFTSRVEMGADGSITANGIPLQ